MTKEKKLAVVVGDFQCEGLPGPYADILELAEKFAGSNLLFIVRGPAPGAPVLTTQHPLDIHVRSAMIASHFPNAHIFPVCRARTKAMRSERLNAAIARYAGDAKVAVFSDLSILDDYDGPYPLRTFSSKIAPDWPASMPEESSLAFRRGVIYAAKQLAAARPRTFQTVDIAVVRKAEYGLVPDILLGRKAGEIAWCLPGGHVMPSDASSLHAAKRELAEETNLHNAGLFLLGEFRVDDWRYRSESQPFTQLFLHYFNGQPHDVRAADDLAELTWQPLTFPMVTEIVPEHVQLLHEVWAYVQRNPPRPQAG